VVALVLALWSASKGTRGVVEAINVAYDQREQRGVVKRYLVGLGLTVGSIVFVLVVVALVAGVPAVLAFAGLDLDTTTLLRWARWPVLLGLLVVAVAAVYYVAPDRESPKWQWLTPGSALASLGLLAASGLFSLYVTRFGDYNEVYGSVGAVAVFMLWLYIASFMVLLGAELNSALEQQVALHTAGTTAPGVSDASSPGATEDPSRGAAERAGDGHEQEHDHEHPEP
jgi:membrane protein